MKEKSFIRVLLPAAVMLLCGWSFKSLFHEDVPTVAITTTRVYRVAGADYFLLRCAIYRRPKGIARFPDGGQPDRILSKPYLMRLEAGAMRKIAELPPFRTKDLYFGYSLLQEAPGGILVKMTHYDEKFNAVPRCFLLSPENGAVEPRDCPAGGWVKSEVYHPIALYAYERGEMFFRYDELGLPNPVDHIRGDRSPEALARIIGNRKWQLSLRLAAAARLAVNGETELLKKVLDVYDKDFDAQAALWTEVRDREREKELLGKILAGAQKNTALSGR